MRTIVIGILICIIFGIEAVLTVITCGVYGFLMLGSEEGFFTEQLIRKL